MEINNKEITSNPNNNMKKEYLTDQEKDKIKEYNKLPKNVLIERLIEVEEDLEGAIDELSGIDL